MCRTPAAEYKGKRHGASGNDPTRLRGLSRIRCQSKGVTRPDVNLVFDQVTYHAGSRSLRADGRLRRERASAGADLA